MVQLITGWIRASSAQMKVERFRLRIGRLFTGLSLALALTRRVRDLLWALGSLGWLLLNSRKEVRKREVNERSNSHLEGGVLMQAVIAIPKPFS